MTYEQFSFWLKGYLEGGGSDPATIMNQLNKIVKYPPTTGYKITASTCPKCYKLITNGEFHTCFTTVT